MTINILKEALSGYPGFRLRQAIKLVFVDLIDDWSQASVFPLPLRDELKPLVNLLIEGDLVLSGDGLSGKAIISLSDGEKIETTLMVHGDFRNTVCVSSQVGCPMGCKFCATGMMGFKRNLSLEEILIQIIYWARFLKKKGERISNIVFMGMGEPLLNYENVFLAIKILNDAELFNISNRRISISTIGILDKIKKMSDEKNRVNLAISLHSPFDSLRNKLMPYSKKYSLSELFHLLDSYIEKTGRKVMLEYLMIKGVNDGVKEAEGLISLIGGKTLYSINLIKYNETGAFKPSDNSSIKKFKNLLQRKNINVIERYRINQDVFGACGQLALKKRA